jgi:hypothetical protein
LAGLVMQAVKTGIIQGKPMLKQQAIYADFELLT